MGACRPNTLPPRALSGGKLTVSMCFYSPQNQARLRNLLARTCRYVAAHLHRHRGRSLHGVAAVPEGCGAIIQQTGCAVAAVHWSSRQRRGCSQAEGRAGGVDLGSRHQQAGLHSPQRDDLRNRQALQVLRCAGHRFLVRGTHPLVNTKMLSQFTLCYLTIIKILMRMETCDCPIPFLPQPCQALTAAMQNRRVPTEAEAAWPADSFT